MRGERQANMTDYDRPRTPPETPPAIDPDVDAKTASELDGDGDTAGEVLGNRSDISKINEEMSDRMAKRSKRDGAGEERPDARSEERRVGNERRSRWSPDP